MVHGKEKIMGSTIKKKYALNIKPPFLKSVKNLRMD